MYGISARSISGLSAKIVAAYDLIVIGAAHHNVDYDLVQKNAKMVFDTKNVMADIKERYNIEVL